MSVPFFFAENISSADNVIVLDEENSRHIVQVLRMKQGKRILLTDGKGNAVNGEIVDAHKKHCTVNKISLSFTDRPGPLLTIAISLTKNPGRFEWFLEKATELGTAEIIPLLCERTEKQHARYDRLVSICKSAMLQSNQAWMPFVHQPTAFKDVVGNAAQQQKLFGHISEANADASGFGKISTDTKRLSAVLNNSFTSHIIVIGPEGDFTEEEIIVANAAGFEGVSFGESILRVETAGIYAAVVHAACV